MDSIEIKTCGPIRANVRPPGSKSITNRALICAALAEGTTTLTGALRSEDTQVMSAALQAIGIEVSERDAGKTLTVQGAAGRLAADRAIQLDCRNSGTSIRFLSAMLATGSGEFHLDGIERMRQRPIEDLLVALRQLGANAACDQPTGCPPLTIRAEGLLGGQASVRGDISSQFLSALLMAAPAARGVVTFKVEGELVSQPYVTMTTEVMRAFGVRVDRDGNEFHLRPQVYQGCRYAIEPDASAASYFFAAAAITGGEITVQGLGEHNLQGDTRFVEVLSKMGCDVTYGERSITVRGGALRGVNVDMNAISDTVQTLAVVALFAERPTKIDNIGHIRHKETDRIAAVATEVRKLGGTVEEREDGLTITPGQLQAAAIDTYDDHRMAMSFALPGLRVPGVVINNPDCTHKTYPEFFVDLASICKNA
ncbi:MAG: 3-phosphoshikimate 1-carboxyvinyltransferase [Pirellulales bacterium]|nr:3-phosphoshikimate 1-carboxyvinyltransferase [Pirellulales bacterium]